MRRTLPTGEVLIVHGRQEDGSWELELEDVQDAVIVGRPLASSIAELLGYEVTRDEWPAWIDDLARDIEAHAS